MMDVGDKEWIWREFLKSGQTTLTKRFPNRFFLTARKRLEERQRIIDEIILSDDDSFSLDDLMRNASERMNGGKDNGRKQK